MSVTFVLVLEVHGVISAHEWVGDACVEMKDNFTEPPQSLRSPFKVLFVLLAIKSNHYSLECIRSCLGRPLGENFLAVFSDTRAMFRSCISPQPFFSSSSHGGQTLSLCNSSGFPDDDRPL